MLDRAESLRRAAAVATTMAEKADTEWQKRDFRNLANSYNAEADEEENL